MNKDLTIIIKTFMREDCLISQLKSINKLGLTYSIVIADDSKTSSKSKVISTFPNLNIEYLELPFNTGLSYGRNKCLEKVTTKYFLLCDDDFCFDGDTRIDIGLKLMKENDFDILGGFIRNYPGLNKNNFLTFIASGVKRQLYIFFKKYKVRNYYGEIREDGSDLVFDLRTEQAPDLIKTDSVLNFFIGQTDVVRNLGWNEELKMVEHSEFFYRAKCAGLKVGVTNKFSVRHYKERDKNYREFREDNEHKVRAIRCLLGYGFNNIVYIKNSKLSESLSFSDGKLTKSIDR